MDLLQLEHFLAVAEELSFTRAAERVHRTQPAVSQSVKKLEEAVGVTLFARDMPDLTLTEAGHALVDYARQMLKLRDDAVRQVGRLHHLNTGHVTIAAYESAADVAKRSEFSFTRICLAEAAQPRRRTSISALAPLATHGERSLNWRAAASPA